MPKAFHMKRWPQWRFRGAERPRSWASIAYCEPAPRDRRAKRRRNADFPAFLPGAGRFETGIHSGTRVAMRCTYTETRGFGLATDPVAKARMRVRASYLLSQWVQAPIIDWREADT